MSSSDEDEEWDTGGNEVNVDPFNTHLTQRLRVARALRDASGNAYVRHQSSIQDVHVEVAEMTLGDALDLREAEANRVARSLADLESRLSELREHRL